MSYAAASDTSAVYFSGRSYHNSAASIAATQPGTGTGTVAAFKNGDTPGFSDLLDIVNPLQHIPIISTIYRQLTGDSESAMASIAGGALYGGPVGLASAMLDLGVHDATGKSTGDNVMALFTGDKDTKDTMTAATGGSVNIAKTAAAAPTDASSKPLTLAAGAMPAPGFAIPPAANATTAMKSAVTLGPASMTPTVLGQSATPAPTAAKATASAKPVVVASNTAALASTPAASAGPVHEGNYLVFGSGGGDAGNAGANGAGTNGKAGQADIAPSAARVPVTMVPDAAPKQFATNGGNATPAKSLPALPLDGDTSASAAPAPSAASINFQHSKVFPAPPRNGPAAPPAVLPPPTTGPGALPGGKSQALSAQEMAVAQDPAHNFLSAYTQALDKYHAAQNLAAHPIQPATSIVTGKPDPIPAVATDEDAAPGASDDTTH